MRVQFLDFYQMCKRKKAQFYLDEIKNKVILQPLDNTLSFEVLMNGHMLTHKPRFGNK